MNFYKNVIEYKGKLLVRGVRDNREYKEKINWNVWSEDVMDTSGAEGWEDEGGSYVIPEKDKIIKVNTKTVKCDNDHPVVWYSLKETGFAICEYCNMKYVYSSM